MHQRDGLSSYDLSQVNFWKTLSQLELSPTKGLQTKSPQPSRWCCSLHPHCRKHFGPQRVCVRSGGLPWLCHAECRTQALGAADSQYSKFPPYEVQAVSFQKYKCGFAYPITWVSSRVWRTLSRAYSLYKWLCSCVFYCTVLYRGQQCSVYFKLRVSGSKHKSSDDVAGAPVLFKVINGLDYLTWKMHWSRIPSKMLKSKSIHLPGCTFVLSRELVKVPIEWNSMIW